MWIVAGTVVLLIVLAWFLWPSKSGPAPMRDRPDVDERELEEAERDVREAPDEENIRDWGPGTGQKPLP
jgi:beta-lactam-binding protein with PASTA domain